MQEREFRRCGGDQGSAFGNRKLLKKFDQNFSVASPHKLKFTSQPQLDRKHQKIGPVFDESDYKCKYQFSEFSAR